MKKRKLKVLYANYEITTTRWFPLESSRYILESHEWPENNQTERWHSLLMDLCLGCKYKFNATKQNFVVIL